MIDGDGASGAGGNSGIGVDTSTAIAAMASESDDASPDAMRHVSTALGETQVATTIKPSGRWRRRVATLVAFVVLVIVGREIRPEVSRAATPTLGSDPIQLGSLQSRTSRLEMAVRNGEVRYRVIDADGKVLAADLNEAQLATRFPRLDLRKLHAQQLMLVEPGDER